MDLQKDWKYIRKHFSKSFASNLHVSIASVDENNFPIATPVGSFFISEYPKGFYFEMFISKLPRNAAKNRNVCVLGVNSNRWFWTKALFKNKFEKSPALKLYGTLGEKRKASDQEIDRLNRRMRKTRWLKGHQYLWGSMEFIHEIEFHKLEKINLGRMTAHL